MPVARSPTCLAVWRPSRRHRWVATVAGDPLVSGDGWPRLTHGGVRTTAGGNGVRGPMRSRRGGWPAAVALVLVGATLVTGRPASAATYVPEPYCQLHVLGSLYGDASGNG